ncbi:MAG: patatin-like phospholipase family protein [Thaumarchaeota archaeon]|nr:patatin-like phospholipase family protein [Nitrososphaerota archaeon]MDE1840882.1 patatin-like phospholipase family protein [Nitrososphaerota archaeon]MDE1877473.1 patatin-like phospholipase family protein [Nitrososphaerota archaeon]
MVKKIETVFVLQGGGALGAYECGVYKAISRRKIKLDIITATSIGSVNAAIITGSKNDEPAKALEDFWLSLADTITSSHLPDKARAVASVTHASIWGNKAFTPRWLSPNVSDSNDSPYIYDNTRLRNKINEYVDFERIRRPASPRIIITCTDIQNGKPTIFDSKYDNITADHILASAGYPYYGIQWTKVSGRYLWDGTLLSNTPLIDAINASPDSDKNVYLVDLFPHAQEELPKNMEEVWHRARDIMFFDKIEHTLRVSNMLKRYLELLGDMHKITTNYLDSGKADDNMKQKILEMEKTYHKLTVERGGIIRDIVRVERKEDAPYLFEDSDFSLATIKKLIRNGENDANKAINLHLKN